MQLFGDVVESLKHEFVQTNGIRMHYVTAGKGPLIVMLHGFPQFWYTWRHQIQPLSEKYCVVAPDLRGYGQTDRPTEISDYSLDALAQDIVGLIKALGYNKAHIVGHDWGGAVAWKLALDYPEYVDRLVVLNSPHPRAFARALKSDYRQMAKSWYIFFFQIPALPEGLFKLFSRKITNGLFRGTALRKDTFSDHDIELYYRNITKPGAFKAALDYYRAAFRQRAASKGEKQKSKQISAPTLLIWGEDDKALGKELTLNMDSWFDNSFKVQYIPQCSHWVNEEEPEVVTKLILEHFR